MDFQDGAPQRSFAVVADMQEDFKKDFQKDLTNEMKSDIILISRGGKYEINRIIPQR